MFIKSETHVPFTSPWMGRCGAYVERHAVFLAIVLVAIASLRIAATWHVFNVTIDEAAHIACGMEWLEHHTYNREDQHPPLARVAAALGPYLLGIRSKNQPSASEEGAAILMAQDRLQRNLTAARAGILPFFWSSCVVVFVGTRILLGQVGAVFALFLWSNLPIVLAHSSLATTDMALTAMLGSTALASVYWFKNPTVVRALVLGIAGALAVLSKFSSLPFLACGFIALLLWRPQLLRQIRFSHIRFLVVSISVASMVIWAAYWFSYGPVRNATFTLPAPEFFSGLISVKEHNEQGHPAYLLGSISNTGFKLYYPVAFGVKTPLPFLALLAIATGLCLYKWRKESQYGYPLAFSCGILTFAILLSRINIGLRHILPVYLGFCIISAFAIVWLLRNRLGTWVAVTLTIWFAVTSALAHPDYLAYFNEISGHQPEKILIDSDLDWGQDMKRLAIRLQELKITEFTYKPLIYVQLAGADLPPVRMMDMERPSLGWHAGHITALKLQQYEILLERPNAKFWTNEIAPVEHVGRGILLWHITELPAP